MIATNPGLPQFVRDLIAGCPVAGDGVNRWLFQCARVLHAFRTAADIEQLLAAAAASCGRVVTAQEIKRAVSNSRRCAWRPGSTTAANGPKQWPQPNLKQIAAIVADGIGLVNLWDASPVRFHDNKRHAEEIVDALFPGNPLLCVGTNSHQFHTRPREEWRGRLSSMPLIVPSPMSAATGLTQEGKTSAHTLNNTGPRKFLVIECDFALHARDGKTETACAPIIREMAARGTDTLDMGAAILSHLAERAPLALAVHSAGKSLHGWFYTDGQSEERLKRFMRYAVSIGADRATWTRSQFVRLPDGTRENGKRQAVYYFNSGVLK